VIVENILGLIGNIGYERDGEICCIIMIKAEKLGDAVGKVLGPMLKDAFK